VVDSPGRVCLLSAGGGSRRDGRRAFTSARDAASCALSLQRELADDPVLPRLALHTSEAGAGPEGDGPAMSHCDCIRDSASAGQVVLSQQAADLVSGCLPVGCGLTDLGWHRLPDLGPPEHLWQLSHPDLRASFPPPHTLEPGRHNLPVQLTSFVGRRDELAKVAGLVAGHRLVTLTGSGGCGKTRLALHAAAGRVGGLPDGVWLVELAPLTDPGQLSGAVASALPVRAAGAASGLDGLATAIGDRALLLILDNCEHLARRCAEVAERLLLACPRLRLLATSREPLGVPGEVTWRVPSLSFPVDAQLSSDELGRFEAVQLFTERSRRARPGFTVTAANARSVAEICGRLDGIPLALELAAARMRVLSAEQIAAGLRDRFQLLTGGSRTAMPRQQTLEASVAWSYHLLDEDERALLRRLSAFAGGFSPAAAEAVGAGGTNGGIGPEQILALLSQLADKSLIQADDEAEGRFGMLETVRHYAGRRLIESGEAAGTWRRHFEFFLAAADRRPGESADAYRERLRADYDNIRQALEWAASQDDPGLLLGLATRLGEFWSLSIHLAEARRWLRIAAERGAPADLALRARALGSLAQVASLAADMTTAMEAGTAALELLRQLGDADGMIVALTSLGSSATIMGEADAGRPYLDEAIALAEQTGDQRALAYALALLGRTAVNSAVGRDAGREALRRSLAVARSCDARDAESIAIFLLGVLDALDCKPADALALLGRALPGLREAGDGFFLSFCLTAIAHSHALLGDFAAADEACDELDAIGEAMGPARLYFSAEARGWLAFCRGQWPQAVSAFRGQLSYYASVALRGMWTGNLAWSELLCGEPDTARRRLDDFIRTSDPARTCLALPLAVRALIARGDGDHERAEELAHAAVADSPADAFGRLTVWTCLAVLAAVSTEGGGGHEVAARLAGAADAFARSTGLARPKATAELIDSVGGACRAALGHDRFAGAWAAGQDMTLEDAAAYASRGRGRRRRPATGWAALTPTELRVARAVADGLSNPQIAERMFISRRTVATHLTSIFRKLGISSRAELAAVAVRRDG
jgi:predicted ATPase/DNA-binding CsgD family transcriptional regulator